MDNEAPEQVPTPTSSRELQKERPSETKTAVPPRTKRQKIKDKTQLISDSATLQQQQPRPLMVLPPAVTGVKNELTKTKKKNKRQRFEEGEDDASKESEHDAADDDDGTKHDGDLIRAEGNDAAGDNGGAAEDLVVEPSQWD